MDPGLRLRTGVFWTQASSWGRSAPFTRQDPSLSGMEHVGFQDIQFWVPVFPAGEAENFRLNRLGRGFHVNSVCSLFARTASPLLAPNRPSRQAPPLLSQTLP